MALLFEIRLTAPQIDLLRRFVDFSEGRHNGWPGKDFSHFVVHVRPLLRERLISHTEVKEGKDKVTGKPTYRQVWEATEKGKALMRVIDFELLDTAQGRKIEGRGKERRAWQLEKASNEAGEAQNAG